MTINLHPGVATMLLVIVAWFTLAVIDASRPDDDDGGDQ